MGFAIPLDTPPTREELRAWLDTLGELARSDHRGAPRGDRLAKMTAYMTLRMLTDLTAGPFRFSLVAELLAEMAPIGRFPIEELKELRDRDRWLEQVSGANGGDADA